VHTVAKENLTTVDLTDTVHSTQSKLNELQKRQEAAANYLLGGVERAIRT